MEIVNLLTRCNSTCPNFPQDVLSLNITTTITTTITITITITITTIITITIITTITTPQCAGRKTAARPASYNDVRVPQVVCSASLLHALLIPLPHQVITTNYSLISS